MARGRVPIKGRVRMPVVGTAGHVDHGKTLLVHALTGIDTDRLPEEKKRGMTIDLGFAHFLDPAGRAIGVIDVPGHERYIRNMVAGAFGMDCAVLVVAADDGWMPQTEAHARVLSVFQVKSVILALTKIDLVSPEWLDIVEEEVRGRAAAVFGRDVPVVRVSGKTGEGVEALKGRIVREIERAATPEPPVEPTLTSPWEGRIYIDRVFSLKGVGTIVAGSLKKGSLRVHEELLLLPRKERVRVRRIQSYHLDLEEVRADESTGAVRVALNLHGISTPPERGDCLVSSWKHEPGKGGEQVERTLEVHQEFLAVGYCLSSLRVKQEAEIAFGTAHRKVTVYRITPKGCLGSIAGAEIPAGREGTPGWEEGVKRKRGEPLRMVLEKAACLWPGDRFLLMRPGGAEILGWGEVLRAGKLTSQERKKVAGLFQAGCQIPPFREVEAVLKDVNLERRGSPPAKASLGKGLEEGGEELGGKTETTRGIVPLSNQISKLLQEIHSRGETPWELKPGGSDWFREAIDRLCKEKRIVPLESTLFMETKAYLTLVRRILSGRSVGDKLTIEEAKRATGLSRKYILPLLNRMERDGWVKRRGADRLILRS